MNPELLPDLSPLFNSEQWKWYRAEKGYSVGCLTNKVVVCEAGCRQRTVFVEVPGELLVLLGHMFKRQLVSKVEFVLKKDGKASKLYCIVEDSDTRVTPVCLWRYTESTFPVWAS